MFVLTGMRYPMILHALICMPGAVALMLIWFLRHDRLALWDSSLPGGIVGDAAAYPLALIAVAHMLVYSVRKCEWRAEKFTCRLM
jgi:hypothetical protein